MAIATFQLGFKALAEQIPDIVGEPLEEEHYSPEGDSLQATTKGLLVWRKSDNYTAFTNGDRTWVSGPNGIEERGNTERLDWESNPEAPSPVMEIWTSPNHWDGRPYGSPIAIVIHTEAGFEAGAEAVFMNPNCQTSAHYGISLDGHIDQFVQLGDRAWANGILEPGNGWGHVYDGPGGFAANPNHYTVSVETEDKRDPAQVVTDSQYLSVHAVCRLAIATYPSIKWLLRHGDISPRSRPNCPGPRWVESGRFAQLASDLRLRTLL